MDEKTLTDDEFADRAVKREIDRHLPEVKRLLSEQGKLSDEDRAKFLKSATDHVIISGYEEKIAERMARNPLWYNPLEKDALPPKQPGWAELSKQIPLGRDAEEMIDWKLGQLHVAKARNHFSREALTKANDDLATATREHEELQTTVEWIKAGEFRLERVQDSIWHKLRDYALAHEGKGNQAAWFEDEPQVFLIQHDWAAAFSTAKDMEEGEFILPNPYCAFEFVLSGRRVLRLVRQGEIERKESLCIQCGPDNWFVSGVREGTNSLPDSRTVELLPEIEPNWNKMMDVMDANIRALCIALDAEVVVSSAIRAPHRLNSIREKNGKLPILDHHVVNLARRTKADSLPTSGGDEAKWHPRLHFRRGHWRHYQEHKTWIRWCLVGNPDLGFIDKHYRA